MEGEVIKQFLVGLGFGVDDASLAKFNKSIVSAAAKITTLYGTVAAAATGIFSAISHISQGFEDMGYELRLVAPAVNKFLVLRQAMLDAYRKAGVDITKVVKQSILFNYSLAKTKFALEALYKSVGAKFIPVLTKQLDIFRTKIFQNMPKIQAILEKLVTFVFKMLTALTELGMALWGLLTRIWGFFEPIITLFKDLNKATDGWSNTIIFLVAAITGLVSVLGFVPTLLLGILALYDDFKVWEEGGKSFFNWGPVLPIINAVRDVFIGLKAVLDDVLQVIFALGGAFVNLIHFDFSHMKENLKLALDSMLELAKQFATNILSEFNVFSKAGTFLSDLFSGKYTTQQLVPGLAQAQPLTSGASNNNIAMSQKTEINVHGAADARATGQAVASQQSKVNFDMTRNLKGALQ